MNQSIEIEGKKYISSRRAAEITKYANDYVGQLCRQGKVKATRVGRQWYIDQDSILDHKKRSDEQLVQNGKNAANFSDSKFRNAETSPESAATKIEVKHEEEAIAQNVADAKSSVPILDAESHHALPPAGSKIDQAESSAANRDNLPQARENQAIKASGAWEDVNGYKHLGEKSSAPLLSYAPDLREALPELKKKDGRCPTSPTPVAKPLPAELKIFASKPAVASEISHGSKRTGVSEVTFKHQESVVMKDALSEPTIVVGDTRGKVADDFFSRRPISASSEIKSRAGSEEGSENASFMTAESDPKKNVRSKSSPYSAIVNRQILLRNAVMLFSVIMMMTGFVGIADVAKHQYKDSPIVAKINSLQYSGELALSEMSDISGIVKNTAQNLAFSAVRGIGSSINYGYDLAINSFRSALTQTVSYAPESQRGISSNVIDSMYNGWNSFTGGVRNGILAFLGIGGQTSSQVVAENRGSTSSSLSTVSPKITNSTTTIIQQKLLQPQITNINNIDSTLAERVSAIEQQLSVVNSSLNRQTPQYDYIERNMSVGSGGGTTVTSLNGLTGTLAIGNGGTNNTSYTPNALLWFDGNSITSTTSSQLTVGSINATSNVASIFPYASTTALTVSGIASTTKLVISGLANGNNQCLQVDAFGNITATGGICGSGGSGGSWATTTSTVANRLINYSQNNSDIIAIGSNSTTTAKFFFDPNTQVAYLSGNVGIGTTSPFTNLSVVGNGYFSGNILASNITATGTLSALNIFATGSSTLQNFTFLNATGTQATTTNFFATYLNSTNATSTSFFATTASSSNLFATNANIGTLTAGAISASSLSLVTALPVAAGGTGQSGFGQGTLMVNNTGAFISSTSPTFAFLTATSTTATSTFYGGLSVLGNINFNGSLLQNNLPFVGSQWTTNGSNIYYSTGSVGIGTSSPGSALSIAGVGNFASTGSTFYSSLNVGNLIATSSLTLFGSSTLQNFTFLNATGTQATTTNFFATYLNSTNATSTSFFATTASSSNLFATNANIGTLTAGSFTSPSLNTSALTLGLLNGPLQANNGVVSATTSIGVLYGGTGQTSFSQGWLAINNTGAFVSSTSPTVAWLTATSTTATSTFGGNLTVNGFASTSQLSVSGSATSTFTSGINIATGCFSVNGTCLVSGGASGSVNSGTQGQLAFYNSSGSAVSGTSTIFIAANSNVGIGTSTPWADLSVAGTVGGTNPLFAVSSSTSATATSTAFVIDANGRVGIGTSTPGALNQLAVAGNVDATSYSIQGSPLAYYQPALNNYFFAIGTTSAPFQTTTQQGNIGIGPLALANLTTPGSGIGANTAIGYWAMASTTTGYANVALGYQALNKNTTGNHNIAIGYQALSGNTTNFGNIAMGYQALTNNNQTGNYGVAIGDQALASNSSGDQNTAVGRSALAVNGTGSNNSAFGSGSLGNNTNGSRNSAFGFNILNQNSSGYNNSALGYQAFYKQTTGSNNVALGYQAGFGEATSTASGGAITNGYLLDENSVVDRGMTFLGFQSSRDWSIASTTALSTSTAIGAGARVGGSNMMALGGIDFNSVNVGIGTSTPIARLTIVASSSNAIPNFLIATSTGLATSTAFIVDSNGNTGVGTSSPSSMFAVAGNVFFGTGVNSILNFNAGIQNWFNPATTTIFSGSPYAFSIATSSTASPILTIDTTANSGGYATTSINSDLVVDGGAISYDHSAGVTSIDNLQIGGMNFDSDAGIVNWADLPVTSSSALNTVESYQASIAGNALLTLYSQADGQGGILNTAYGVGIGTTSPSAMLEVLAGSTTPTSSGFTTNYNGIYVDNQATSSTANVVKTGLKIYSDGPWNGTGASNIGLYVAGVSGGTNNYDAIFNGSGIVGIGTTSPYAALSVVGASGIVADNINATNTAATSTFAGGFVVKGFASTTQLMVSGAATSTFTSGINIATGCYAVNGSCLVNATSSGVVTSGIQGQLAFYNAAGNTVSGTSTVFIKQNGNVGIGTSNPQGLFDVNGLFTVLSSGNVGIGTTSPYAALSVVGAGGVVADNFNATNTNATSTFAGNFVVGGTADLNNAVIGPMAFSPDAGAVSWIDMPIASSLAGTAESYSAQIAETNLLTVYANSNGAGGFSSYGIGIGSSTPYAQLAINPNGITPSFVIGSSTQGVPQFTVNNGFVGIGTSTPYAALSVVGSGGVVADNFNATNTNATSTFSGGFIAGSGNNLVYENGSGTTYVGALQTGNLNFDTDAGMVSWADMPLSSAPNGTFEGYTASLNGSPVLSIFGIATSSANVVGQTSVGIGTTTPYAKLSIFASTSTDPTTLFAIGSTTTNGATTTLLAFTNVGNLGLGTTTPFATLSVFGNSFIAGTETASLFNATSTTATSTFSGNFLVNGFASTSQLSVSGSATSTFTSGINLATGCFAVNNTCVGAGVSSQWTTSAGNIYYNTGNVGIGTTSPYAALSVVGSGGIVADNINATNTLATSTLAGGLTVGGGLLNYDSFTGVTSVNSLQVGGALNFDTDAGAVQWADMAIDSSAPAGSVQSYTASLNGSSTFMIYGLANGTGALQNDYPRISIGSTGAGSTTPTSKLTIFGNGTGSGGTFEVVNNASTTLMKVLDNGNVGIGTTTPGTIFAISTIANFDTSTSTIYNNLNVLGTTHTKVSQVGDLVFGNQFRFLEAPSGSTTQGLALQNQNGAPVMMIDEHGDLGISGDICSNNVTCFGKSITSLNDALNALASTTNALGSTTKNMESGIWNLIGGNASSTSLSVQNLATAINILNVKIDNISSSTQAFSLLDASTTITNALSQALASSTILNNIASSTADRLASTTADKLTKSTSFIGMIADAVQKALEGMGNWIIDTLTAKNIASDHLQTQTAAVTQGLEMTDQATGQVYCVTIKNAEWNKELGACAGTATSTVPVAPITTGNQVPTTNNPASLSSPAGGSSSTGDVGHLPSAGGTSASASTSTSPGNQTSTETATTTSIGDVGHLPSAGNPTATSTPIIGNSSATSTPVTPVTAVTTPPVSSTGTSTIGDVGHLPTTPSAPASTAPTVPTSSAPSAPASNPPSTPKPPVTSTAPSTPVTPPAPTASDASKTP